MYFSALSIFLYAGGRGREKLRDLPAGDCLREIQAILGLK